MRLIATTAIALFATSCVPSGAAEVFPDALIARAKDALPLPDAIIGDTGEVAPLDAGFLDAVLPDALVNNDRDGDGLPDDEDPDPDVQNALLFGDTFETTSGPWIFASTGMRIETASSLLRVPMIEPLVRTGWLGPRPQWGDVFIRGLIRVQGVGNSASPGTGRVGLMGHVGQVTPGRYVFCGVDLRNNEVVLAEHPTNPAGTTLATAPFTPRVGEWIRFVFDIQGPSLRCTVDGVRVVGRKSSTDFAGSAGFRSFDASFDADWFEIYDR